MTFEIFRINPITKRQYSLLDELRYKDAILVHQAATYTYNRRTDESNLCAFTRLTGRDFKTPYSGPHYISLQGTVREVIGCEDASPFRLV